MAPPVALAACVAAVLFLAAQPADASAGRSLTQYLSRRCVRDNQWINPGEWYDAAGERCMCRSGRWVSCEPLPDKPCESLNVGGRTRHGAWGISSDNQECYCNNGEWIECGPALLACQDGYSPAATQVMLLYDLSSSISEDRSGTKMERIGHNNWWAVRAFSLAELLQMPIGECLRVGIASYSHKKEYKVQLPIDDVRADSAPAVHQFFSLWYPSLGGNSKMGHALTEVRKEFTQGPKKIVIVVSDGESDDDIIAISRRMRFVEGYTIIGVAIGVQPNYDGLINLTGNSEYVLEAQDATQLHTLVEALANTVSDLANQNALDVAAGVERVEPHCFFGGECLGDFATKPYCNANTTNCAYCGGQWCEY